EPGSEVLHGCQNRSRRSEAAPIGRSFQAGRMACGRLASSRWREAGDAAGLERDLSPQRFGRKEWRMAALLVGRGLAAGPSGPLSRLCRLAQAASRQRPDPALESRALA